MGHEKAERLSGPVVVRRVFFMLPFLPEKTRFRRKLSRNCHDSAVLRTRVFCTLSFIRPPRKVSPRVGETEDRLMAVKKRIPS